MALEGGGGALLLGGSDYQDSIRRETGGHGVQINVVRNHVLLGKLFPSICGLNSKFLTIEFDSDVLGTELLHVESQLVLLTLLHLEEDCGLSCLGGRRSVVFSLLHPVVGLWWGDIGGDVTVYSGAVGPAEGGMLDISSNERPPGMLGNPGISIPRIGGMPPIMLDILL